MPLGDLKDGLSKSKKSNKKKTVYQYKPDAALLASTEDKKNVQELTQKLSNINLQHLQVDGFFLVLVSQYGLARVLQTLMALNHVPANFPQRYKYILSIANHGEGKHIPEEAVRQIGDLRKLLSVHVPADMKLLWDVTTEIGIPHTSFLITHMTYCQFCDAKLCGSCDTVIQVTRFTLNGPLPALKGTLRCQSCRVRYTTDGFVKEGGFYFYKEDSSDIIKCTNKVYMDKAVKNFHGESLNHAFVSFEAFAEIYNQSVQSTQFYKMFQDWKLQGTNSIGMQSVERKNGNVKDRLQRPCASGESSESDDTHELGVKRQTEMQTRVHGSPLLMTRKNVSEGFYNNEVAEELRERDIADKHNIKVSGDRENIMRIIDEHRRRELYEHSPEDCSDTCRQRGCTHLRVWDGCWKLCFPHCMMCVPSSPTIENVNLPNVCTNEPVAQGVFCEEHMDLLQKHCIPTDKKLFLQHLKCKDTPQNGRDMRKIDEKVLELYKELTLKDETVATTGISALSYQDTQELASKLSANLETQQRHKQCNKDTGNKVLLRQRSRGVLVNVTGGLQILYWSPLFKSEGPSQVWLQMVKVMEMEITRHAPDDIPQAIKDMVVCYDNICHVDSLKAAQADLPLPDHLKGMWKGATKAIDRLHLRNHKKKCHEMYNPDKLPATYNTMACEQLFAWAGRFKKIVNSMTKTHHQFFLHRIFKHRNRYSSASLKKGTMPLMPGINPKTYK